jgi:protoheme IX farnesyltransferase
MATEAIIGIRDASEVTSDAPHSRALGRRAALADYWALTKPEINFLIAIATFAGFYFGCKVAHAFPLLLLIHTLLGTLLVASGAATLNQYVERDFDALMRRTARRPLVVGRIQPAEALWFGIFLSACGAIYLAVATNVLASLLAVVTFVSYLFLYTPLKRKTPLCTLVGALPGAMPPLIGYAAATGRLGSVAWALYIILFLWQFPHFMSIAWMYREDYDRAGYKMLPNREARFRLVALQTILPLLALVPMSLSPTLPGQAGILCFAAALLLSCGFLYNGTQFVMHRSCASARRLLFASIIDLPSLFLVMIVLGR